VQDDDKVKAIADITKVFLTSFGTTAAAAFELIERGAALASIFIGIAYIIWKWRRDLRHEKRSKA
jgi:hypothetical protein